jgi:hypothetical protein
MLRREPLLEGECLDHRLLRSFADHPFLEGLLGLLVISGPHPPIWHESVFQATKS